MAAIAHARHHGPFARTGTAAGETFRGTQRRRPSGYQNGALAQRIGPSGLKGSVSMRSCTGAVLVGTRRRAVSRRALAWQRRRFLSLLSLAQAFRAFFSFVPRLSPFSFVGVAGVSSSLAGGAWTLGSVVPPFAGGVNVFGGKATVKDCSASVSAPGAPVSRTAILHVPWPKNRTVPPLSGAVSPHLVVADARSQVVELQGFNAGRGSHARAIGAADDRIHRRRNEGDFLRRVPGNGERLYCSSSGAEWLAS